MDQEIFTSHSTGMLALIWSADQQKDDGRTMLYLHGAGGFRTGLTGLFDYPDFPSLLRDGMEAGCRVVIPSCHAADEWQPSVISAFLDDYECAYGKPIDGYDLLGYSRGGVGAYRFSATEPWRIRTLSVVSSKAVPQNGLLKYQFPVLICHGLEDLKTPISNAYSMHEDLRAAGVNCTLYRVQGDHYIIAGLLSDGCIFQWQRDAVKR